LIICFIFLPSLSKSKYGFRNLENFHGTGAFNLTKYGAWDSILVDMLQRPKDVVVVRAGGKNRGAGGWSKKNPYLEERFIEIEIDIDPTSLVSRIVSVREQIANEWVADLDTLLAANELILTSYYDNLESSRDDEECIDYDRENGGDVADDAKGDDCIDTERLAAAYTGEGITSSWNRKRATFDRNAMIMLSNSITFDEIASSPYRQGNFDLLVLLATQESVHRVLQQYRAIGDERKVSFEWLREFYTSRIRKYFDGGQEYGRADDFLEELLATSPSMRTVDDFVEFVDPMRICSDILQTRSAVAEDWKAIVQSVPQEHMELRKVLLARQMGADPLESSLVLKEEDVESNDMSTGAFD